MLLLLALSCRSDQDLVVDPPEPTGGGEDSAIEEPGDSEPCVPSTWHPDDDEDGYGDPTRPLDACEPPEGYVADATDCDDHEPAVHPGAPELCNHRDDDCDARVDDDDDDVVDRSTWYQDADLDQAGDIDVSRLACFQEEGWVPEPGDCNDSDPLRVYCRSCKEGLDLGRITATGAATLDPCGGAPSDFWCDMDSDGGGWTLAGWQDASATTSLGIGVRNSPGDADWSVDLACLPYQEIAVFNRKDGDWQAESYPPDEWSESALNIAIGAPGVAFKEGTYGPANSQIVMGCVGYAYNGQAQPQWACDSDSQRSARGHLADYAGEYCAGARLDYTWAWSDGNSCSYRGEAYSWGFSLR